MPPVKSPAHLALGDVIREVRHLRGISQEELADRADVHRAYLGHAELGQVNIGWANLLSILDALDLDVADFGQRYELARRRRGGGPPR